MCPVLYLIWQNRKTLDDITIECWEDDISDGRIGGKATILVAYWMMVVGSNAIYDGTLSLNGNQLCITMENLHTKVSTAHTLTVGFRIILHSYLINVIAASALLLNSSINFISVSKSISRRIITFVLMLLSIFSQ